MIVYVSLLLGAVGLGIPMCRNKAGKIAYCSLMGIALFVVGALRRRVGWDYPYYAWVYYYSMTDSIEEMSVSRVEKGYYMLNKVFSDHFYDFQTIFVIMAFFFAAALAYCVYRYCERPWLGFAFFLTFGVYFNSFNFMRQTVASFILLYAMKYIKSNQFFRFLIIVLFATCFHRSALIMIPFYFILRIKMNYISLGVYAALTTGFMIFSWDILEFVSKFLYAYKGYISRDNPDISEGVDPTFMIFLGICFVVAFIFRERLTKSDPFNNVLINCLFFTFLIEIMGVKHSAISRIDLFFVIPASVLLMPKLFEAVIGWSREKAGKDKKKRKMFPAAVAAAFAVFSFTMYGALIVTNYNGVIPYKTVFDSFETGGLRNAGPAR